jgi:predicted nucleic acid-binding protein
MTEPIFVDTNVWVYAVDAADPVKRQRALEVTAPAPGRDLVISTQVLTEFYAVVTRKLAVPVSIEDAEALVRQLAVLPVVAIDS